MTSPEREDEMESIGGSLRSLLGQLEALHAGGTTGGNNERSLLIKIAALAQEAIALEHDVGDAIGYARGQHEASRRNRDLLRQSDIVDAQYQELQSKCEAAESLASERQGEIERLTERHAHTERDAAMWAERAGAAERERDVARAALHRNLPLSQIAADQRAAKAEAKCEALTTALREACKGVCIWCADNVPDLSTIPGDGLKRDGYWHWRGQMGGGIAKCDASHLRAALAGAEKT